MDLKEFDVLYDKTSPLFNNYELGNLVSQVLKEENVHSKHSKHLKCLAVNNKPYSKFNNKQKVSEVIQDLCKDKNFPSNCTVPAKTCQNHNKKSFYNQNAKLDHKTRATAFASGKLSRELPSETHHEPVISTDDLKPRVQACKTNTSILSAYVSKPRTSHLQTERNFASQNITNEELKINGEHYQNSSTLLSNEDEKLSNNSNFLGKDSSSGTCENKCRLSSVVSKNNRVGKHNTDNRLESNMSSESEELQIHIQQSSASVPTAPAVTEDISTLRNEHTSQGTSFREQSGVFVDSAVEKTICKHVEDNSTYKKADDKGDVIIPVEIGCFEKREMVAMIESLVTANQLFFEFPRTNEPEKKQLIQEQNKYLEQKKHQRDAPHNQIKDEKHKIRARVLEHSVKYIEMRIAESVKFAKKIPGFVDLPLEDQANLIRESRTESGIIGGMRGINTEKGVFTTKQGAIFSMEDMKLVFDESLLMEKMVLSKKIANLNMSLEEEAILRALTITATDRCELVRRDRVEDIHNKLMSCLIHVISEKDEGPVSRRLGKLCDLLMSCRYVTEVDMRQVKKIFLEWPSFSDYKLAEEFL